MAIPPKEQMTGNNTTEAQFKSGMNNIVDYLGDVDAQSLTFGTTAELKLAKPKIGQKAKTLDSGKVWEWKGVAVGWIDTGEGELERAKEDTTKKMATRIPLKKMNTDEDLLIAFTDLVLNKTWLEVNSTDGGLSEHSKAMIERKLNIKFSNIDNDDYFLVLRDQSGNLTDIALRSDGQFANFVVERLAHRLLPYFAKPTQPSHAFYYSDTSNKAVRVESTDKILATWGSSSIDRSSDYIADFCNDLGIEFIDGGVGGEDIDQTRERQGEGLQEITFNGGVIPAFNEEVTISIKTAMHYLGAYDGWIIVGDQKVNGRIEYRTATKLHYFKRTDTGSSQLDVDSNTAFQYTPATIEKNKIATTLLWAGKNNLARNEQTDSKNSVAYCIQKTRDMFKFLSPTSKRCLVIGHFVDTNTTELVKQKILDANALLESEYGDVYLDIQNWMCSEKVWLDTGITPTSDDLIAQSEGRKPPSVSHDSGHFKPAVYKIIVNEIFKKLQNLGWY